MSERLDTALRWAIFGYAFLVILVLIQNETCSAFDLPNILFAITFTEWCANTNNGYDLIVLAVLVVFRFIVFGKTYQK